MPKFTYDNGTGQFHRISMFSSNKWRPQYMLVTWENIGQRIVVCTDFNLEADAMEVSDSFLFDAFNRSIEYYEYLGDQCIIFDNHDKSEHYYHIVIALSKVRDTFLA